MINGTYEENVSSYLSLLERKINTSVPDNKLRWLFKFTNDMTKDIKYSYGKVISYNDRYVQNDFIHNTTESVLTYQIDFKPYGFWAYEVYEVSWIGTVTLGDETAPLTETQVLEPVEDGKGVVQGKVHEGKLYISEKSGSEQVRYTNHTETTTNYLYTDY
jgi:hypothetical protein